MDRPKLDSRSSHIAASAKKLGFEWPLSDHDLKRLQELYEEARKRWEELQAAVAEFEEKYCGRWDAEPFLHNAAYLHGWPSDMLERMEEARRVVALLHIMAQEKDSDS